MCLPASRLIHLFTLRLQNRFITTAYVVGLCVCSVVVVDSPTQDTKTGLVQRVLNCLRRAAHPPRDEVDRAACSGGLRLEKGGVCTELWSERV